jgi:hypothetical protein
VLEPLMEVIAALGRLPDPTEFAGTQTVVERFGSLKRAFAVIRRITDSELWESIARRRREDMLKESFLLPEHKLYAKFARLTAQEESAAS